MERARPWPSESEYAAGGVDDRQVNLPLEAVGVGQRQADGLEGGTGRDRRRIGVFAGAIAGEGFAGDSTLFSDLAMVDEAAGTDGLMGEAAAEPRKRPAGWRRSRGIWSNRLRQRARRRRWRWQRGLRLRGVTTGASLASCVSSRRQGLGFEKRQAQGGARRPAPSSESGEQLAGARRRTARRQRVDRGCVIRRDGRRLQCSWLDPHFFPSG